ncbi:MAG: glucose-6-phosphate isomerase, partial [Ignavibacteriae bacterium]|nr:glucose-6-phosphate isomerase [Ignavibacteriota bacterium]
MFKLNETDEWGALQEHYDGISNVHMRILFEKDKDRFNKYHIKFNDILFDFSKNRIDNIAFKLLIRLAEHRNLKKLIEAMFTGEKINTS